jgi:hypothetical protein
MVHVDQSVEMIEFITVSVGASEVRRSIFRIYNSHSRILPTNAKQKNKFPTDVGWDYTKFFNRWKCMEVEKNKKCHRVQKKRKKSCKNFIRCKFKPPSFYKVQCSFFVNEIPK